MYTDKNYKTKKELMADFKSGRKISTFQPGFFPAATDGKVCLEGPHYPAPHKWYATAQIVNSIVVKIS